MADSRTATPTNPADTILAIRKTMETHMGDVMHVDLSNKTIKLERTKSGNLVSDPFQSSNVSKPSAPRSLSRSNSDMRLHSMSTATSQAGRGAGAAAAAAVVSGAPVPPIDGEPGRSYGLRHSHSQSQSLSGSQHGGDPSSRMGSRQELSSLKSSKADLRNMGSLRNLSSTSNARSLEALGARGAAAAAAGGRKYGSISNLNRINEATAANAAPTPAQEKAAAAKQIESILNKAQRKIDARLEKAEDNLWKTNESLYKAHGTTMYPSKTTGSSSNFSVFAAANKAASDELDIDSRSARRSREGGGNDDRDGGDSDDENEEGFGSLSRSGSHFLLNKSVKLPPIGGGGALASTAGGSKSGSAHLVGMHTATSWPVSASTDALHKMLPLVAITFAGM
ncbi:hypothetical protein BC831DRAFT_19960 [Entophlyctis helioformis]|nr:hypothetical protein BC831DRAFT_19960 [Entophlyctis helioformis]